MSGALLRCLAPRPTATRRLICLPYAGGGPSTYHQWDRRLPDMEVWAALLPGHPGRMREPVPERLTDLAGSLAEAVGALPRLPLVLFGHSMGAVLALELASRLEVEGRAPLLLCVSGRVAPSEPPAAPISHLDDAAFVEALRNRYGGLPPEVVANEEIMQLMLPVLRADVRMLESHPAVSVPVSCPILALGGTDDRSTPEAALGRWRELTTAAARVVLVPGGHFFLEAQPERVTSEITRAVAAAESVD